MSNISGLIITYQCVVQDYPFGPSIRSMLDFADVVYVNDGGSTDGTLDILYTLQRHYGKDRLVIVERNWEVNREFWARERNLLLDNYIPKGWVLSLDADEVLHESEFNYIKEAMNGRFKSVSFGVVHFYGLPSKTIQGPAWFKRHTQLWHTDTGIRWKHIPGGCADDIVWPDGTPAHWMRMNQSKAKLYHYGHCRDPKAMGIKTGRAHKLYQSNNDVVADDIEYRSWRYDINREGVSDFTGTHPKYIIDWVEAHKNQPLSWEVSNA